MSEVVTVETHWDCECSDDYIHPKALMMCPKCGAYSNEQPDSRLNELQRKEKKMDIEIETSGSEVIELARMPTVAGITFVLCRDEDGLFVTHSGNWTRRLQDGEFGGRDSEKILLSIIAGYDTRPKYLPVSPVNMRQVYACDCIPLKVYTRIHVGKDRPLCPLCGEEMAYERLESA